MGNPLHELQKFGQSVWYDNIARNLIKDGSVQKLIDEFAVVGVTSNPTIFEKAIAAGNAYDEQIRELVKEGKNAGEIFDELAIKDIQEAADLFRPIYDSTNGKDGYISLEVSPVLAHDTDGTIKAARYYYERVNRPNLMIKIPATPEGIPAITATIASGINVNVTLIFSLDAYENVAYAYIEGLEKLAENGSKPVSQIASVASFFVSRVDTLVDKLLEQKGAPEELKGKAAIANSRLAYERFEQIFSTERWQKLEAQGAKKQRMLWASTSTKNPSYRDVIYVEELVGPETVDTMPPQTVVAFADHGQVTLTVNQDYDKARELVKQLETYGITMEAVTDQLLAEGVKSFADSYKQLLDGVESKRQMLLSEAASL
jgi:transaldolase